MNHLFAKIQQIDFQKWTIVSLLAMWPALTFSIALSQIALVTAIVFWSLHHLRNKTPWDVKADWSLWAPLALFVLFVIASFFTSEYLKESTRGLLKIAKSLLLFFIVADSFRFPKTQRYFYACFIGTFLLVAIDSSIQYIFGKDLLRFFAAQESSAGRRIVGPFGDFGRMSCYLLLVIPMFGMFFSKQFKILSERKKSFYLLALAISGFILLYLTRTRGALLALAFSFFALFLYKRWFKILGVGILLCLVLLSVTPKAMIFHFDVTKKEQSLRERYHLWRRAIDVIEAKPWTGTGINTYNVAHEKYDKHKNWRVRGYYAHNGYLQLTAEIGIPGILAFLAFLFMYYRRALQHIKKIGPDVESYIQLGFLTGMLAFLLYALVDTGLQSPQSIMSFWFIAGILMARQKQKISTTPIDKIT